MKMLSKCFFVLNFLLIFIPVASANLLWDLNLANFHGEKLAMDQAGFLYAAGTQYKNSFDSAFRILKLTREGQVVWDRYLKGGDKGLNMLTSIAVGGDGSVVVTGAGRLCDVGCKYDFMTAKYDASGNLLWRDLYDNGTGAEDWADEIRMDVWNNVYIVGHSYNGSNYDLLVIKYAPDGRRLSISRFDSGQDDSPESAGQSLQIDIDGNVYVLEMSWLIKYASDGTMLWKILSDRASAFQLASFGIVLTSPRGTASYDGAGTLMWRVEAGGSTLATDTAGGIWLSKNEFVNNSYTRIVTSRLTSGGELMWQQVFDSGTGRDSPSSIVVDQNLNAFVTGKTASRPWPFGSFSSDFLVVAYSPGDGTPMWHDSSFKGWGTHALPDGAGGVYAIGTGRVARFSGR
ncbi:MAG: hypothetical protein HQK54_16575 [Oligoflexales bacterium]|nr:hypothetical protein [Oligoflexales bacterium]